MFGDQGDGDIRDIHIVFPDQIDEKVHGAFKHVNLH
jgi:hypothetical protein